jgi:phage terminase small subunit
VIQKLQEAIEIARIKADPAAMIRGWVEVAKMCGLYAPVRRHVEISASSAELAVRIREMRDEELLALASGAM